jgi:hypothetical protein
VEFWGDFDVSSYPRGGTVELLRSDYEGTVAYTEIVRRKRKGRQSPE